MIVIKSSNEIAKMREAGRLVAQVHQALREKVKPGVSTADLDAIAYEMITRRGAKPSFLGYRGFPASICASINQEVVHGIPNKKRVLQEGDIIAIDVGATLDGFVGDAAFTVGVGRVSETAERLIEATEGSLLAGIAQVRAGNHLDDISGAVQDYAESRGFSVVREYVGHGVGRTMHEEPGMTLAIEPMVNEGVWETRTLRDKWTVVTQDGKLSAHFEHTVAVTEGEPEILTKL